MHASRTLGLALAGLALTAVPATAQVTPATGKLSAFMLGGHKLDGKRLALKGDEIRVKGRLRPAIAGQRVQVRLNQGGKTVKVRKVAVKANGRFATRMRLSALGKVSVAALHKASGAIERAEAEQVKLRTYEPSLRFGSDGRVAELFNRELRQLRYPAPRSGTYDTSTGDAVMAYRKVNGFPRSFSPNNEIVRDVIAGKGAYEVRHPELGRHVEADISQQILALIDGDKVVRVYHTSSGAPATPTILGTYRFYSQTIGTNSVGMVHSNYFIRGYAIHGYRSVPPYNASHGCLRVPIHSAYSIFKWIDIGDQIRVDA